MRIDELVARPALRVDLLSSPIFGRGYRFALADGGGASLASVRQRTGSPLRWLSSLFVHRGYSPKAVVDVVADPGGVLLTISKPRQGATALDLVATAPDGQLLGTVTSGGHRRLVLADPGGAPLAGMQRTAGTNYAVEDGHGVALAAVTAEAGVTDRCTIAYYTSASPAVRVLTLAATIGESVRRIG